MSIAAAMTAAAPILIPSLIGAGAGAGLGALTSEDGFSDDNWWKGAIGGGLAGGLGGGMGLFSGAAAPTAAPLGTFGSPAAQAAVTPSSLASLGGTGGASTGLLGAFGNPAAASITPNLASLGGTSTGALGLGGNASALAAITPEALATSPFLQGLPGITEAMPGVFEGLMPSQDTLVKGLLLSAGVKGLMPSPQSQSAPKAGSLSRGQRPPPFQTRQPIPVGGRAASSRFRRY